MKSLGAFKRGMLYRGKKSGIKKTSSRHFFSWASYTLKCICYGRGRQFLHEAGAKLLMQTRESVQLSNIFLAVKPAPKCRKAVFPLLLIVADVLCFSRDL